MACFEARFNPLEHMKGWYLWLQKAGSDGELKIRQIGTLWNCADIGTKPLWKQRLCHLLHFMNGADQVGSEESHAELVKEQGNEISAGFMNMLFFMAV